MPIRSPMTELESVTDLLEVVPDAVFVVAEDGTIAAVNAQAETLTGYVRGDLVGRSVEQLVPLRHAGAHSRHRDDYFAAAGRRPMGTGLDTRVLRRDGVEVPVDIALSPLRADGRRYAVASVRDISAQRRNRDQLDAALATAQAMLAGAVTADILELVAQKARLLADASVAMVVEPDEDGAMVWTVAIGEGADRIRGFRLEPDEDSLSREVMASGEPAVIADVAQDGRLNPRSVDRMGLRSMVCVPLRQGSQMYGTLTVGEPAGGRTFGPDDVEPLVFLATQASLALEHARIQGELQRLALVDERERIGRELHDGAIQAIFAIGMSLEGLAARAADAEMAGRLRGVVAQLDGVIRDLRNYIYGLRPGIVSQQHLEQAIRQLVDDFAKSSGVTAVADVDPEVAQALAGKAGDVVLLAGEALSNVGRHAQALTARVTLRRDDGVAVLEVEDDGSGFDPAAPPQQGQGLRNLRDRAARMGGTAHLESRSGEGTTVRFTLPL